MPFKVGRNVRLNINFAVHRKEDRVNSRVMNVEGDAPNDVNQVG